MSDKTVITILDLDQDVSEWARINQELAPQDPSTIGVVISLEVLEALNAIGSKAARANVLTRADEIYLVMAHNAAMEAKWG